MSELRHDRASIRAHRERIIKKKKKLLDSIWYGGYTGEYARYPSPNPPPLGKLAKHSTHHHSCSMCSERYNRAHEKKLYQGIV